MPPSNQVWMCSSAPGLWWWTPGDSGNSSQHAGKHHAEPLVLDGIIHRKDSRVCCSETVTPRPCASVTQTRPPTGGVAASRLSPDLPGKLGVSALHSGGRSVRHSVCLLSGRPFSCFLGTHARGALISGVCSSASLPACSPNKLAQWFQSDPAGNNFLVEITLLVVFLKVTKTFSCVFWFYTSYLGLDSICLQKVQCPGQGSPAGDAAVRRDRFAPKGACCSARSGRDRWHRESQ